MDEAGKGEHAGDVLSRRAFVKSAVAAATVAGAGGVLAQSPSVDEIPIIDAHIHLFDGARPWARDIWALRLIEPSRRLHFLPCIARRRGR